MKTNHPFCRKPGGSALALTLVMTAIALAILASAMTWSANSTRLTHRSIQYTRSVAAAEAATEKVLSRMSRDYLDGGEQEVLDNLAAYRQMVPTTADSPYWGQWEFNNASGNVGQTHVQSGVTTNYIILGSAYGGLRAFVTSYEVVAHARELTGLQNIAAGVFQEVELARVPIFQFAMYSSGDMEVGCAEPLTVSGRVHANANIYVMPQSALTFKSDVTAVGQILFQRHPADSGSPPGGSVVYQAGKKSYEPAMTLPIGTTNTPTAIREIIHPPPFGEDPNSPLGRLRYYNQVDMIIVVSNSSIRASSGVFNNSTTAIPTNELAMMVTTTNSFRDAREGKTIRPIDLDVGRLAAWSTTNTSLRAALGSRDVSSVYVLDRRTLPGTELGAVRLRNGQVLPSLGLTVATPRPLYVFGHYNQFNNANLGTTNTSTTRPASIVSDAVSFLSTNWQDSKSTLSVGSRVAASTTVNAAILTGVVETAGGYFSGGMENFPRFLETWGTSKTMTYNGSMVKMFPSLYATNRWGKSDVYSAPSRKYAYDFNFYDPTKLPPLTPSLLKIFRGQWATVAPDSNVASAP